MPCMLPFGQFIRSLFRPFLVSAVLCCWAAAVSAADARPGLAPCWLDGVEHQALCGHLSRPLNPAQPAGTSIQIHYAVLPALARNRLPDPVFFVAGGPGQSAIELAGPIGARLSRLNNRRDLVLVDQRGTGQSAPLRCAEIPPTAPIAALAEAEQQVARLRRCREQLLALPYGDLRFYATPVATEDLNAVRMALQAERIDLVGGSYGTRVVLDYMRQFPKTVRRAIIDGVAPPDMQLPVASSPDNQAALDAVLDACAADARCRSRYPDLRSEWRRLLASLPLEARVAHPLTGVPETLRITGEMVLALVRTPLYVPGLAAGLPAAIAEAARGRFEPMVGLASAVTGRRAGQVSEGMHFSVICSEDLPLAGVPASVGTPVGTDFGDHFAATYRAVCADWPRASVPPDFYRVPTAAAATLVLSGGADPVTPPRHGERVARELGSLARHVVVPQAGHGVLALPCMRDVAYRFISADSDAEALAVDAGCALHIPRPPAFVPLAASIAAPEPGSRR